MSITLQDVTALDRFRRIKADINALERGKVLVYQDTDVAIGQLVASSLVEDAEIEGRGIRVSFNSVERELTIRLPNFIQSSHSRWLYKELSHAFAHGFFSDSDWEAVELSGPTTFTSFASPYQASFMEPDQSIGISDLYFPTVVVEAGWSERYHQLIANKDLWLKGGASHVNVVFIAKYSKAHDSCVEGHLEVFRKNGSHEIHPLFQSPPSPDSSDQASSSVNLTRAEIFGECLPSGQSGDDVLTLSLDRLRQVATKAMGEEGYTPITMTA